MSLVKRGEVFYKGTCLCKCKRSLFQDEEAEATADGGAQQLARRAFLGLSIGSSSAPILRAELQDGCTVVRDPASGTTRWAGSCAESTLAGRPIKRMLQEAERVEVQASSA